MNFHFIRLRIEQVHCRLQDIQQTMLYRLHVKQINNNLIGLKEVQHFFAHYKNEIIK